MRKIIAIKVIVLILLISITTVIIFLTTSRKDQLVDTSFSPSYRRLGNPEAKILIIEYSDFACPACGYMNEYIKNLIKYFPDEFFINFKHLPLSSIHPYSFNAALWVECAGIKENKFFEVGNIFFKNQREWWNNKDYLKLFEKYTREAKADVSKIRQCYDAKESLELVKKDLENADRLKLDSTPSFFVNGKLAKGGMELVEAIKQLKR